MTATWIWASSMYASVEAGYKYGISGPIHYGLWGALMIYLVHLPLRPPHSEGRTQGAHARGSHVRTPRTLITADARRLQCGGFGPISLTSNFIAGGAIISMLSPISFGTGILVIAGGVLLYTLWSGFRASVLTDFVQVMAMMGAAAIIIPVIFFTAGGPSMFGPKAHRAT